MRRTLTRAGLDDDRSVFDVEEGAEEAEVLEILVYSTKGGRTVPNLAKKFESNGVKFATTQAIETSSGEMASK